MDAVVAGYLLEPSFYPEFPAQFHDAAYERPHLALISTYLGGILGLAGGGALASYGVRQAVHGYAQRIVRANIQTVNFSVPYFPGRSGEADVEVSRQAGALRKGECS